MRVFTLVLVTFFFAACAAPVTDPTSPPPPGTKNQPHLPPPDFESASPNEQQRSCGGMIVGEAQECPADEFCRRTIGDMCGAADAQGFCSPIPQICTQDYRPVCGCDGQTYSNECAANAKGVSASYAGECK